MPSMTDGESGAPVAGSPEGRVVVVVVDEAAKVMQEGADVDE